MIDGFHTEAAVLALTFDEVPDEQVVAGAPQTGIAELDGFSGVELGVWEMTAGAMSDTEADEVFVVIAGSAVIDFVDDGTSISVGTGDVVRLTSGQRTIWRVADRIRKVYLSPPA